MLQVIILTVLCAVFATLLLRAEVQEKYVSADVWKGFASLCFVLIGVSAYLLYRVVLEVITTITLKQQLAVVEERYQEVLDENEYLTREREKLEDPDYVASYARGNYLLSKDDEQIFYLPEDEDR